jgi:hypothetical protein
MGEMAAIVAVNAGVKNCPLIGETHHTTVNVSTVSICLCIRNSTPSVERAVVYLIAAVTTALAS